MTLGRRLEELSVWQSRLTLRSRLVPNHTTLVFQSRPQTLSDPVAPLDTRYDGSAEFTILREWLVISSDYLRSLPRLDHNDADGRLQALLEKFEEEITRLESLLSTSWTRELVEMGLLFREEFINAPKSVNLRKLSSLPCTFYLTQPPSSGSF